MNADKKFKKVFFEFWAKDGYKGRWIYSRRHMRFSEADVPTLYEKRPHKEKETKPPDYLYRIENDGIHIGLFYDGLPEKE